ncbi:sugar phosphate isomerase/epimerase family protein [Tessaracoccus coleopterorum]|uniref:sugar phosphate isomerase/epimerase family protein n=1 Tax=Tessaracoccus coleopterorum TaxID=2714950 RepID=UPI001E3E93E8|nr:hydroxypyruvate isomerase [Tessaracoccus coleopterorum]
MTTSPFVLAASAETLFTDKPVPERLRALGARGLEAEIWNWRNHDLHELAAVGVPITSMTGYVEGELVDPDGARRLLDTARESIEASRIIDCPRLNLHGTGLDGRGCPCVRSRSSPGLTGSPRRGPSSHSPDSGGGGPGVHPREPEPAGRPPGTPFALARDTLALVRAVDHPNLRLNLDLYHAQIGRGTSSSCAGRRCRGSVRSRWPTSPAAVSRAPARSTTAPSPSRWPGWATAAPRSRGFRVGDLRACPRPVHHDLHRPVTGQKSPLSTLK